MFQSWQRSVRIHVSGLKLKKINNEVSALRSLLSFGFVAFCVSATGADCNITVHIGHHKKLLLFDDAAYATPADVHINPTCLDPKDPNARFTITWDVDPHGPPAVWIAEFGDIKSSPCDDWLFDKDKYTCRISSASISSGATDKPSTCKVAKARACYKYTVFADTAKPADPRVIMDNTP